MRMLVVGGGPGGLYLALLTKHRDPAADLLVVERNRADDTFGWGVVLSDQTVSGLQAADPVTGSALAAALHHWDDIEVHFRERVIRSGGHGFSGVGRHALLRLLQQRCAELGVQVRYECDVSDVEQLAREYRADIVIAADGANSATRARWRESYKPSTETRSNRFIWLGTPQRFDAFLFAFEETEHGWVQAHAYQFDETTSTFIVEMPETVWHAHGLHTLAADDAILWCETVFSRPLHGRPLMSNATHRRGSSLWQQFPRVSCASWTHWLTFEHGRVPVVLLGDAAHTAHFSIGSGTKLALEDAIDLHHALSGVTNANDGIDALATALMQYEQRRSVETLKLQNAARNSTEWFEHVDRYATLAPEQFAYSLLTRSQRISHEGLRVRDPEYIAAFERWFAAGHETVGVPPMFTPYTLRGVTLSNRVVVSPMAQYSACENGTPSDWHFVHLGARAAGGAGLVMTEMTCVAPDARITPWCPGMWNDAHAIEWGRIVRFVHDNTRARIALQLGHAGAKGATRKMWEGVDTPLATGAWPLVAPSAIQYLKGVSQVARAMTRQDMKRVLNEFVYATELAERAGFDWVELHCAHGYLLSAFLSPLTNRRDDEYGGALQQRLRYPLEVFCAMRAAWPVHKPMSVRISAHDWSPGGNTADDAVQIARAFQQAGADMIDVSAGQVVKDEQPVFGRMWQTPFADRIRQETGIATMAVGSITDADQANGILSAGRADLVAVGRPHLANPAWTLTEAARLEYNGAEWPAQYLAGKAQLDRLRARERAETAPASATGKPGELT